MSPFVYSPYHAPYTGSISELLMVPGQAQARAAEQSGQAWSQAAQGIGQGIAGAVQQVTDPRLQEARQHVADLQALDKAFTTPGGREAIIQALPGHLRPTVTKQFADADEAAAKVQTAQLAAENATSEYVYGLADNIKAHAYDPTAAQLAISHAKQTFAGNPSLLGQIAPLEARIRADPRPETIQALIDPIIAARNAQKAKPPEPFSLRPNETRFDANGQPIASNPVEEKPTEASLAERAAKGDLTAKTALELLQSTKGSSGELKAGRLNGKMIFATFDPKTKRLMYQGQDVTDALVPPRDPIEAQAAAIAAQVAQQTRAQTFQEQQAGRRELTEKVEAPFRQAQQSAQELRDLVNAAKAGNKEAASLQALQATMSTVRANGLNRLNQAEMNLPANAGSLWDKIQNKAGKVIAGQPINADLQKDLLDYADLIEKGAYNRYKAGHTDVMTRYKLSEEKLAPPPKAPAVGTEGVVNGKPAVWDYRNGQWGWWEK